MAFLVCFLCDYECITICLTMHVYMQRFLVLGCQISYLQEKC